MSKDDLKNFPNSTFIALFDFDEVDEDSNGLSKGGKETNVESNPFKGLTKQLIFKKVPSNLYVALLPVPKVDVIKKQVLKADDTPWGKGADSHLAIELPFYKEDLLGTYFTKVQTSCGGERITFSGNKVKFAQEFVLNLSEIEFEIFRSMFDFIKQQCA